MRIVILTEGPFPYGMAATTRMVTYARGMTDAGADVSVLYQAHRNSREKNTKHRS